MAKKKVKKVAVAKGKLKKAPKKSPTKAKVVKASAVKVKTAKRQPPEPEAPTLGRPKVTQEEKLFMLFKEDYPARQIFEFLRAETVRDLETWSAEEIVRQLSKPIRQSVERIRLKLAQYNRSLKGDEQFALDHRTRVE